MTIREMIEMLEELEQTVGSHVPVIAQIQQSYPLKVGIKNVISNIDIIEDDSVLDNEDFSPEVYIVCTDGTELPNPYGDAKAWDV